MKRKEVLESQQINEALLPLLVAALVGAGIERNRAQQAARQVAANPEVANAAGGAAGASAGGAAGQTQTAPTTSPRPQARPQQGGGTTSSGTLRRGSTGPQVSALQRRLGVEETGTFDDATEEAVRAFQQRAGIQVDGVVGGQTQAAFAAGGTPRNAGAARAGAADFDYSSGQRPAPAPATGASPAVPSPDARDFDRESSARYTTTSQAAAASASTLPQNTYAGAASNVANPYTGGDRVRFARMSNADQEWLTRGGGRPDINDPNILRRAPNGGQLVRPLNDPGVQAARRGAPTTAQETKTMNKETINEASVNINGTAEEIAELMRMMQLAGASGAKPVDTMDINPGPKPCPICGKIHGPMPKPGGCGGAPMQGPKEPAMGDMIRMMSMEADHDDGGFEDATTEPDDAYMGSNAGDMSDVIPDGNDLHKEKDSYPATAGGDNPMRIKEELWKALAEKKKAKPDYLDFDGDGNKKEPMKKALKDKKKK